MVAILDFSPARLVARLREVAAIGTFSPNVEETILEALRRAYHLSTDSEEGRPIQIAFAVTVDGLPLPGERRFEQPVYEPEGIRRLCLASNRERSCLRFERMPDGRFAVLSIAGRPRLDTDFAAPHLRGSVALVEAIAPACIVLTAGAHEVRHERGAEFDALGSLRGVVPYFIPQAIVAYLTTSIQGIEIFRCGGNEGWKADHNAVAKHRRTFETVAEEVVTTQAAAWLHGLLKSVRAHGHGGTIVLAADTMALVRDSHLVDAHHVIEPPPLTESQEHQWNAAILNVMAWSIHQRLALERGITVAKVKREYASVPGVLGWGKTVCAIRITTAARTSDLFMRNTAQLTQVDGALLLNERLDPCAFGVKFLVATSNAFAGLPEAVRDHVGARGMRHRSAACVVAACPNSLALVVSQDGKVTAFGHLAGSAMTCTPLPI